MDSSLKEFIAQPNNMERLRFFKNTFIVDWSMEELDIVGNIINLDIKKYNDISKKHEAISKELLHRFNNRVA